LRESWPHSVGTGIAVLVLVFSSTAHAGERIVQRDVASIVHVLPAPSVGRVLPAPLEETSQRSYLASREAARARAVREAHTTVSSAPRPLPEDAGVADGVHYLTDDHDPRAQNASDDVRHGGDRTSNPSEDDHATSDVPAAVKRSGGEKPTPPPVVVSANVSPESPSGFARLIDALTFRRDRGSDETNSVSVIPASAPTDDENLLIQLINVERTARGLQPVAWDGELTQIARLHAADMSAAHKMSHNSSSDGADFGTRLARTTYRARGAAENVAFNSDVLKAHRALMDSPGHRRNILDPNLTAIGPAVAREVGGNWIYVAEDFATPIAHITDADAAAKIRQTLLNARARSQSLPLPEDTAMSKKLGRALEQMISSGSVRETLSGNVGWTLAFTSMDPSAPPPGALEHATNASRYALAVTFRKTKQYPLGTYWALLFLGGGYESETTASASPLSTSKQ
jgi:uncharacterized protein YkwD